LGMYMSVHADETNLRPLWGPRKGSKKAANRLVATIMNKL
jgi:hypothetical protein